MAACGSLQHIFETPLPAENPTLLDPLSSWNIQPVTPINNSSFTEIFGELHFNDNSPLSSSSPHVSTSFSSSSLVDLDSQPKIIKECNGNKNGETDQKINPISKEESFLSTEKNYNRSHKSSDSFSSMNSESLQLCTEGLGFESSGDVEDLRSSNVREEWQNIQEEQVSFTTKPCYMATSDNHFCGHKKSRSAGVGGFPPPISCISKSGKPWVCFKSYRHNGRFVLKEIRIPTQEFLHAYREGGRLKLNFIHHEDEQILSEVDREDDDDDEEEDCDDNTDDQEENEDEHADDDAVNEGNEANTGTCSTNEV
ncbi:putative The fantastic four family protein [Rosa chinensis]|uniref:Putative The fantastic four family protein n=1 Tax=Rosa chinensis TaxID=74649 RepID=A0A2P6QE28_ROSCH|nr:putative The fantastic four family protein [Rosa chinensis]PRQ32434.1 putative The fantastic four family protein [Rosa chinensis]